MASTRNFMKDMSSERSTVSIITVIMIYCIYKGPNTATGIDSTLFYCVTFALQFRVFLP